MKYTVVHEYNTPYNLKTHQVTLSRHADPRDAVQAAFNETSGKGQGAVVVYAEQKSLAEFNFRGDELRFPIPRRG